MVILSRNKAIGMCSREGLLFLQEKVESPTQKFDQSIQRTSTLEDISETGVTLSAGAGRSQSSFCRTGTPCVVLAFHSCTCANSAPTSVKHYQVQPRTAARKCTGAAALWLRANTFNAMTADRHLFLTQSTANPLQWVFKYLQWLFLSSRLCGGRRRGEILEAFNKNIHPICTRET